jgi:hypothetical protein
MKKATTFIVILFFCLTATQAQFTFTNHTPILSWKWVYQTTQGIFAHSYQNVK